MTSSVSLKFPYPVLVALEKDVDELEPRLREVRTTRDIVIGDLRPWEEISVIAWSHSPLSQFKSEKITVSHASGVGLVAVLAPVNPFWWRMARDWRFYLIAWPFLVLFLVLTLGSAIIQGRLQSLLASRMLSKPPRGREE